MVLRQNRSLLPVKLVCLALASALGGACADTSIETSPSCLVFVAADYGLGAHVNNIVAGSAMHLNLSEYYLDDRWLQYRCAGVSAWSSLFSGPLPKVGYLPPAQNSWSGSFGGVSATAAMQVQEGNRTRRARMQQQRYGSRRLLQLPVKRMLIEELEVLQPAVPEGCKAIQYQYTHMIMQVYPDLKSTFFAMASAMERIWQLEAVTKAYVDKHVEFLLSLPRPLVAFHVRGGDKASEQSRFAWQQVHAQTYADAVGNFTPSILGAGGTCVYIGDDFRPLSEVAYITSRLIKCTTIVEAPPQFSAGGGHDQAAFNRHADKCTMSRLLLAQIEAMAAADYFVGTYTSNVPRVVQLLRVAKYKHKPETGIDALLRPWVPIPFAHPSYTTAPLKEAGAVR